MIIPVLPLYLRDNGLSYQLVTSVLAAAGVGALVGQVPIGAVISRLGEWRVVIGATLLLGVSITALGLTTTTVALAVFRFAGGIGNTGWTLSRSSFVSTWVEPHVRGRVSSTFGGVIRAAWLTGPLLGGFVASRYGFTAAFAVTGVDKLPDGHRHQVLLAHTPFLGRLRISVDDFIAMHDDRFLHAFGQISKQIFAFGQVVALFVKYVND